MAFRIDEKQARWERAVKLADEVLDESRVQLMLKFRFLDMALWRMQPEPSSIKGRYAMATDGKKVYYEPYSVLNRFDESFNDMIRDYLHMVMHCIFRHPYDEAHRDHRSWWLACDIVAESVAMEMCGGRFDCDDDKARKAALSELRLLCGNIMPGKLYALFEKTYKAPYGKSHMGLTVEKLNEYASLFERDNHEAWPAYVKAEREEVPGDIEELAQPDDNADEESQMQQEMFVSDGEDAPDDVDTQEIERPEAADSSNEGDDDAEGTSEDAQDIDNSVDDEGENIEDDWHGASSEDDHDDEVKDEKSEEEREWEEIAKQIEMNLESFSKEWGEEAGSLIASLAIANRKKYDYSDFLRRFTTLSEEMKINDDEYDYIFYTYGLELYGNMPLVEPLEYKETQRIRDFVICIDTSESCRGDLVRKFVEHTFSIMKKQEDYAHEINVHIIQCDAKVQADQKVTDLRDIDVFMDGFFIRGMGGTDFRPAFAYVNQLVERGELPDMKGLIYFTDGLGQFPDKAQDYDVAFVFMDNGEEHIPAVPPWAMRIIIDEEGINRFKSGL